MQPVSHIWLFSTYSEKHDVLTAASASKFTVEDGSTVNKRSRAGFQEVDVENLYLWMLPIYTNFVINPESFVFVWKQFAWNKWRSLGLYFHLHQKQFPALWGSPLNNTEFLFIV